MSSKKRYMVVPVSDGEKVVIYGENGMKEREVPIPSDDRLSHDVDAVTNLLDYSEVERGAAMARLRNTFDLDEGATMNDAPTDVAVLRNALVQCGNGKRRLRDRWAEAARERNKARAMVEEFRKIYAKAVERDDVTDLEALGHLGNVIWNAQAEARAAQFLQERAEAQQDELAEALQTLEDLTAGCWDEGPPGEGWPSDELQQARSKAREVLAAYTKKGRAVGYDADAAEERHPDETWESSENESLNEQWRKYAQQLKESNDRLSHALGKAERERDEAIAEQDLLARQRDEAFGDRERMRKDVDGFWERGNRAFEQRNKAMNERDEIMEQRNELAEALRIRDEAGAALDEAHAASHAGDDHEDIGELADRWRAAEKRLQEALAFGQKEIIELGPEDSQRVAESLKNPSPPNDALQKLMDERLKDDRGSVLFRRAAFRNMPPVPRFRDKESVRKFVEETRAMMSPSLLDMAGFPRVEDLDDNDG